MKLPQHNGGGPTIRLSGLVISTKVRLAAEFRKDGAGFVRSRGVGLAGGVARKTSLKSERGQDGKSTGRMVEQIKSTFHLIAYGAIVVTTRRKGGDDGIERIALDPALALYGNSSRPLRDGDLVRAMALINEHCGPLVGDAADVCHLLPTECPKGRGRVASFRSIQGELWYPGIELAHLHDLSHPEAGSSRGRKPNFARLVPEPGNGAEDKPTARRSNGCSICFKSAKGRVDDSGTKVSGTRISLELTDDALTRRMRRPGIRAMVGDTMRVIHLELEDVRSACREVVSELEGFCLPVPPEWTAKPGTSKLARMIALIAATTERTPDELLMNALEGRQVHGRTEDRLEEAVLEEMGRLRPQPVAEVLSIPGD